MHFDHTSALESLELIVATAFFFFIGSQMMLDFHIYKFTELANHDLYHILALRAAVFIVDQHCVYLDPDGKDFNALHLLGKESDGELVAYLRIFPPAATAPDVVFGRIVTALRARGKGYGKQLMQTLLQYCHTNYPNHSIKCSAQLYLKKFYESYAFQAYGEVYDEDGIPHIAMEKPA